MKTPIIAAAKNQASTNVALIKPAINLNRELTELPEPDFHIAVVIPAYRSRGLSPKSLPKCRLWCAPLSQSMTIPPTGRESYWIKWPGPIGG